MESPNFASDVTVTTFALRENDWPTPRAIARLISDFDLLFGTPAFNGGQFVCSFALERRRITQGAEGSAACGLDFCAEF